MQVLYKSGFSRGVSTIPNGDTNVWYDPTRDLATQIPHKQADLQRGMFTAQIRGIQEHEK